MCRSAQGRSGANVLMSGYTERILRLWQLKRQEIPEEDLSDRLQVALASWTEPFNRLWYEKITGKVVIDAGRSITCQRHPWRRCLLDGIVEDSNAVFEAKHPGNNQARERPLPAVRNLIKPTSGN